MKKGLTIADAKKIVAQLKAENNPSNKELIEFYEGKIYKAIDTAFQTATKKILSNLSR